jgi:hypothetical protein
VSETEDQIRIVFMFKQNTCCFMLSEGMLQINLVVIFLAKHARC